ncbi:hypothetical protein [Haladaptatus sp. ZSTT2]
MKQVTHTRSIASLQSSLVSPRLITFLLLLAALFVLSMGSAAAMETFHVI